EPLEARAEEKEAIARPDTPDDDDDDDDDSDNSEDSGDNNHQSDGRATSAIAEPDNDETKSKMQAESGDAEARTGAEGRPKNKEGVTTDGGDRRRRRGKGDLAGGEAAGRAGPHNDEDDDGAGEYYVVSDILDHRLLSDGGF